MNKKLKLIRAGRRGGLVRSAAKTKANRAKIIRFWEEVRSGVRPHPTKGKRLVKDVTLQSKGDTA